MGIIIMTFSLSSIASHARSKKKLKLSKLNLAMLSIFLGSSVSIAVLPIRALAESNTAIQLKQIEVKASAVSDTRPVKGYTAKKSRTATKTETELLNVPQAIAVVTQDQIKDQSIQSVSEAVRYVPGVQAIQGEGNRDAIVFRGNATTGDFFIDGIRDDVQTYRDLYNTDRIEVLKGPSGMIFGRGGAGGVVNRVSKEAGWDPIKQLSISYGAYDQKRITADFDQAINDEIAFRINAVYEKSDSYRDGVGLERYGVTPTFTIIPSDKTKITLGMEYFKDKRVSDRGIPSANGTGNSVLNRQPFNLGNYSAFYGSAALSPTETETVAFNATIEHAFDSGINLKNSTRYANYNKFYQNVFADSQVLNNGNFTVRGYLDTTKRENLINQTDLTYNARWGAVEHKLLTGLELSTQDTSNNRLAGFFNNTVTEVTQNAYSSTQIGNIPVSFRPNLINSNNAFRNNNSTLDVIGIYVQDQIVLSPKWQAIVGLRHDHIKTSFNGVTVATPSVFDVTDNLMSPRAGLIFKPLEAVSIYTNYSLSYVPRAGDQLTSLTVTNKSFAPEKFINYEIGAKWDINNKLSVNAAIYQLERKNVQTVDPSNTALAVLVDGQTTKGLELGLSGNITEKWTAFGGYAYQEGEITKTQPNANADNVILQGAKLAQTPKHTFSLWNRYDFNDTWGVALGVVSRSDMFAALPTVTQSTVMAGYTRLDAAVYAKINKQARVQVNLENLTNKEYALYAHNNNNITPGSPITGRATLVYDF
jgi:catecholate siderophore receptor